MAKTKRLKQSEILAMRVKIAQDVIQQMAIRRYRAVEGYVVTTNDEFDLAVDLAATRRPDTSCQTALRKLKTCGVCAKGAILMAHIERNNETTYRELNYVAADTNAVPKLKSLKRYFSEELLCEMETLFERQPIWKGAEVLGDQRVDYLARLSRDHFSDDPDGRLMEIMLRLIKSGGKSVVDP